MTLHEAIKIVLINYGDSDYTTIANHINNHSLYFRKDREPVSASQVASRVKKYPEIFEVDANLVQLKSFGLEKLKEIVDIIIKIFKKSSVSSHQLNEILLPGLTILLKFGDFDAFITDFSVVDYEGTSDEDDIIAIMDHIKEYDPQIKLRSYSKILNEFNKINNTNRFYELLTPAIGLFESLEDDIKIELVEALQYSTVVAYTTYNLRGAIEDKSVLSERYIQNIKEKDFADFFEKMIYGLNPENRNGDGSFFTPTYINTLITALVQQTETNIFFDPFIGRGSLALSAAKACSPKMVVGNDINSSTISVAQLLFAVNNIKNIKLNHRDTFRNFIDQSSFADLVVTIPPFGVKMDTKFLQPEWQKFPTSESSANAIQIALHSLKSDGKAFLILSQSFLFATNNAGYSLRKFLITEDLISCVLMLPKGTFKPYAAVNTVLIILDKSRKSGEKGILLYDCSEASLDNFEKDVQDIRTVFLSRSENGHGKWVYKKDVEEKNYDLTVKRYFLQSNTGSEFESLRNLVSFFSIGNYVSSDNLNSEEGLPCIQVSDLIEGQSLGIISKDKIKSYITDIDLVKSNLKEIPIGSVLISKVGTKLKPSLFSDNFRAVASSNIIILKPNNTISGEYLISQLQSDYVVQQIEVIRRYNAIPNFNLNDLLDIKIKVIPYHEQQQYATSYYSKKVTEIEKVGVKGKEDDLYNLISRIKHEVKQPVSSIGIDISIITQYLKEKARVNLPISLEDYAIEPLPGQQDADIEATKLINILSRIQFSVEEAQETLTKAEETLNIGKGSLKLESLDIKHFIETVIKPLYINANCTFEIKGRELLIKADKYQLKVLFKHLIDNAVKHGFVESLPKERNVIRVEVSKDIQKNFAQIIFMNNGKPFSKGFNKTLFESKGTTINRNNGSGFGGYHIKKIIENHQGELEIANDEEVRFSDFKIRFNIYLPLN
jgi:type I restriction-modification system DNA methylase subunit/signal transduction histidine kinase